MKHQPGTNLLKEEMNRVTNKQQTIHATAGRVHHLELYREDTSCCLRSAALEGVATISKKVCQLEEKIVYYLIQP